CSSPVCPLHRNHEHPHLPSFPTRRSSDLPAVGISLANILDLAGVNGFLQNFHLPRKQEIRIRISRGALDKYVIAFRLRFEHRARSEEHTSELQSRFDIVCRLLLENKKMSI